MTGNSSSSDSNDRILADFFTELERRGPVAIQEYRARYPNLATEIDRLVPLHNVVNRSTGETDPSIPQWLGGFRIVRKIDHGGMGEIYEAVQERLDRRVAVKVIRQGRVSLTLRERFLREQQVLARLHQTHIVPIHTADEADGLQYFAMPYIEGATLRQAVTAALRLDSSRSGEKTPTLAELACGETGALSGAQSTEVIAPSPGDELPSHLNSTGELTHPPRMTLSIAYFRSVAATFADAAEALEHAHNVGIIHRDVKPSNIMMNAKGQCCLIDFGLARLLSQADVSEEKLDDAELPLASGLLGTPNYMAPEQINRQASKQSDIWGLGVTLYELLTLRRAFEGTTSPELFKAIQTQEPPPPRQFVSNVPADLVAICQKALRKKPDQRYASAGAFAEDLRRWLRFEPTQARPARAPRQVMLWARRNKGWATALLVVICIGLPAVATTYTNYADKVLAARSDAESKVMAIQGYVREHLLLPIPNRRTDVITALEKTAEPRKLIVPLRAKELDLDSRSLLGEGLACPELVVKETTKLPQHGLEIWPVALHPDGQAMAIGTTTRPLLWRRNQPFQVPPDFGPLLPGSRLSYSPDGKWLLVAPERGGVEVWDASVTHTEGEWKPESGQVLGFGFAPDARHVLIGTTEGVVQPLALPRLEPGEIWKIEKPAETWTSAAFDQQAMRLATGNAKGHVILYDASGKQSAEFKAARSSIEAIAWSHDGTLLAIGSESGRVSLWDIEHEVPLQSFQLMGADFTYLQFTPDGWLLASRRQGRMVVWNTASGQQVLDSDFERGSLSADGKHLAVSRGYSVGFCELLRSESFHEFNGHHSMVQQIVWSADDRTFASIDNGFQIHVWQLNQPRPLRSIPAPREHFFAHRGNAALALSNNGRILAYASGGAEVSYLFLFDCSTEKELWSGKMSGAFEHLAATGDDQFLLVRDERKPGTQARIARQYNWRAGASPELTKVLRESAPEEPGTLAASLSPDGRYFCWVGPAQPKESRRVEIWETESGRVRRFPEPEPDAMLSDDGRDLWLARGKQRFYYDLTAGGAQRPVTALPMAASSDRHWLLFTPRSEEFGHRLSLQLYRRGEEEPWLNIHDRGDNVSCVPSFSRDGRHFAWGVDRGTVKVAELATLRDRVAAFEKLVLPK